MSHPAQVGSYTPQTDTQNQRHGENAIFPLGACVLPFLVGGCSWGTTAEGPEMNMPQLDNKLQLDQ
jgi:hypothetical protein